MAGRIRSIEKSNDLIRRRTHTVCPLVIMEKIINYGQTVS
jgi:hypothetical protein